jgi:hypothetical protein
MNKPVATDMDASTLVEQQSLCVTVCSLESNEKSIEAAADSEAMVATRTCVKGKGEQDIKKPLPTKQYDQQLYWSLFLTFKRDLLLSLIFGLFSCECWWRHPTLESCDGKDYLLYRWHQYWLCLDHQSYYCLYLHISRICECFRCCSCTSEASEHRLWDWPGNHTVHYADHLLVSKASDMVWLEIDIPFLALLSVLQERSLKDAGTAGMLIQALQGCHSADSCIFSVDDAWGPDRYTIPQEFPPLTIFQNLHDKRSTAQCSLFRLLAH